MPLIEAMARWIAAGTPPGDPLALAPTEASPPVVARAAVVETHTMAEPPKPAPTAAVAEKKARSAPPKRWAMAPFVTVGALALVAMVGGLMLRRPDSGDSPTVAPRVAPAAPLAPAAPAAPVPQAAPVAPAAPPQAAPVPPRASHSNRPSPTRRRRVSAPPGQRRRRGLRRSGTAATTVRVPSEQTADGIPIMP